MSGAALDSEALVALLDSADHLTSQLELSEVLKRILVLAEQLTSCEAGSVILFDSAQNDLYFAAATGPAADQLSTIRIPVGKGKAGEVFATGIPLMENQISDHYKAVDEKTRFSTQAMICIPLSYGAQRYGVLQILNKKSGTEPFLDSDLELAKRLGVQATIAIRNATLFEKMLACSGLYSAPEDRKDLVEGIAGARSAAQLEQMTVLFADMRGFSQLCHILGTPVRIQSMLSEFLILLSEAVIRKHGIVNKFLGDGLMAIFRGDDAARRSVLCAFDIVDSFKVLHRAWEQQSNEDLSFLDVGLGIASDSLILGTMGNERVSDFTVIGPAVNLAAGLERDARDGRHILCDNRTYLAVKDFTQAEGPIRYKIAKPGQDVAHHYKIFHLQRLAVAGPAERFFICFASADEKSVREMIVDPLRQSGIAPFFAPDSIGVGEIWDKAISSALENCDRFVIAISKRSISSHAVSDEVHFAMTQDRLKQPGRVLPLVIDDVDPAQSRQIHWQLGRFQYRVLTSEEGRASFRSLLVELSQAPASVASTS